MVLLKRKIQNLYTIITRLCYRVSSSELSALHLKFLILNLEELMPAPVCVLSAGPGVFHRRLRSHRHREQQPSLCRGQTSAAGGGEMSSAQNRWQASADLLQSTKHTLYAGWQSMLITHSYTHTHHSLHCVRCIINNTHSAVSCRTQLALCELHTHVRGHVWLHSSNACRTFHRKFAECQPCRRKPWNNKAIRDACEPGLTAAYLAGLIKALCVIKRNMLCCYNPWSD